MGRKDSDESTGCDRLGVGSALRANGGLGYLVILAVQYGVQPTLARSCIRSGTLTSSLVLAQETIKVCCCVLVLACNGALHGAFSMWTPQGALFAAGVPSLSYLVQNFCIQVAYQNLDGVTFNVLNQSKAIFTAVFSFLISGRRQSSMQCIGLALLVTSSLLVSLPRSDSKAALSAESERALGIGWACALIGAALSGFGSGVTEYVLQKQARNNYVLSIEIAVLGICMILGSLLFELTTDSEIAWREGLFVQWELLTLAPVLTQGLAGVVVGIITQVAGGVRKILATICGLVLTCFLEQLIGGGWPPLATCMAVPLAAGGMYLHAMFPPTRAHPVSSRHEPAWSEMKERRMEDGDAVRGGSDKMS